MSIDDSNSMINGQPEARGEAGLAVPPRAHPHDYLVVLARHKGKLVMILLLLIALLTVYVLAMPHTYTAGAVLLPPDRSSSVGFAAMLEKGMSFDLQGLSENTSAEVFIQMLRSRTLTDSLVDHFDLLERYNLPESERQLAGSILQGGLSISADRHGIMQLHYSEQTGFLPTESEQRRAAEFSAAVVNHAINVLDYIKREKLITNARRTREYLGRISEEKRNERDSIQQRLLSFQQRNKAVALEQQIESAVQSLATAELEINKKELELIALESQLEPGAPAVEMARRELAQLRAQKGQFERGEGGGEAIGVDLRNLPDVAREYANLKLDLEVATEVYTYLEAQYHQEQVQEARDLPTVSVLDWAVPPQRRSAPRRGMLMMIWTPILFFGTLLLIFVYDAVQRNWRSAPAEKSVELRRALGRGRRLPEKSA